ncbi:MAG: DUF1963 domain-containing protein [Candidatus Binatia bacterium]
MQAAWIANRRRSACGRWWPYLEVRSRDSASRRLGRPRVGDGDAAERAREWLMLLELSAASAIGHHFAEGVLRFYIRPEDLAARRFDRVEFVHDRLRMEDGMHNVQGFICALRRASIGALAVATIGIVTPALAAPDTCGDLDGSGSLVASDALLLLKRAVGQNVAIECPDCSPPPCVELGEQCSISEDCCPVDVPPALTVHSSVQAEATPATCCGGTCRVFGICKGPQVECDCGAECCTGSCGVNTPGQCD